MPYNFSPFLFFAEGGNSSEDPRGGRCQVVVVGREGFFGVCLGCSDKKRPSPSLSLLFNCNILYSFKPSSPLFVQPFKFHLVSQSVFFGPPPFPLFVSRLIAHLSEVSNHQGLNLLRPLLPVVWQCAYIYNEQRLAVCIGSLTLSLHLPYRLRLFSCTTFSSS